MKMALIKIVRYRAVLLSTILATSMLFNPLVSAEGESGTMIEIHPSAEAIWQSIDKETSELAAVIKSGKLDKVHLHAFAIRDLTAALLEHSHSLPTEQLARVKTSSQFVVTLAERLDASGDANDKAATESNFQKLQKVLKSMRGNY